MRIEILTQDGRVQNTIMASEEFAQANYPGRWRVAAQQLELAPAEVPQQITRAQGKAVLIMRGLWPSVLAYVDSIADPTEKALANVALHDTLKWERTSPTVTSAAQALGMTSADLDDLFVAASKVLL